MIDFKCLACGEGLSVPNSLIGQKETCPSCAQALRVPSTSLTATELSGYDELVGQNSKRGACKYCGEKVSLLRRYHSECQKKYEQAFKLIKSVAASTAFGGNDLDFAIVEISKLAKAGFVPTYAAKEAVVDGWALALDKFLEDNIFSEEEEQKLTSFAESMELTQEDLDARGAFTKATMAGCIRDVLNGEIPQRFNINCQLPFNFQKTESLVWVFYDVKYLEERIKKEYVGGYGGMSIRVMKGVYYRTGAFKGHPVETAYMHHVDTGLVGITNKHIYFAGARKSVRIPYKKIVSFNSYSDGIGIQRDAASAKPQIFVTGEGWFVYNLVTNLSQLSS